MLLMREQGQLRLPEIGIRANARIVEQLQEAARVQLGVRAVILDTLNPVGNTLPSAIGEIRSHQPDQGYCCEDLSEVPIGLISADERAAIQNAASGHRSTLSPFSCLGWIDKVESRLRSEGFDCSRLLSGEVRQYNGGGGFVLAHIPAHECRGYWLKATSARNGREFRTTVTLARIFPEFLPPLLAAWEDWNAWVMADGGPTLLEALKLPAIEKAFTSLAAFQEESLNWVTALLDAGCAKRGLTMLAAHLDQIIDFLEEAMELQTSVKVPRLDGAQLRGLGDFLRNTCERMEGLGLRDTLVHGDLYPGNILFDGTRCVFIDWAEVYLGNPLLAFEDLAAHLKKAGGQAASSIPRLKELYVRRWHRTITPTQLEQGFALSPVLAIAMSLLGQGDWLESALRNDPNLQAYARSLARRMYAFVSGPLLAEA